MNTSIDEAPTNIGRVGKGLTHDHKIESSNPFI